MNHFVGRLVMLLALLALAFGVGNIAAQGETSPFELSIFRDEDSLTVYLPGNRRVSLKGLQFEVATLSGARYSYALADYPAFTTLLFNDLQAPLCLRLERDVTTRAFPIDCQRLQPSQRFTQKLGDVDVFWYDTATREGAAVLILVDTMVVGVCPASERRCRVVVGEATATPPALPTNPAPAALPTRSANAYTPELETDVDSGYQFARVPAGAFSDARGSADGEYWIGVYEVTNAQYARFLNRRGNIGEGVVTRLSAGTPGVRIRYDNNRVEWVADAGYEGHPVTHVTWFGAQDYCAFIGARLPTATELYKAAVWNPATGATSAYPWGNDALSTERANYDDSQGGTTPVGAYPFGMSAVGVFDLVGNVWEWTSTQAGVNRVSRGGAWDTEPRGLSAMSESFQPPDVTSNNIGFRCAKTKS